VLGVQQDPARFLAGNGQVPVLPAAAQQSVAQLATTPDHKPH